MKTLTLYLAGQPEPLTLDLSPEQATALHDALAQQSPAHVVALPERVLRLNMRQVVAIETPADAPAPEPEPEAAPEPEPTPAPDRTVDELKAALDAAGIEHPSGARKAELVELAQTHGV